MMMMKMMTTTMMMIMLDTLRVSPYFGPLRPHKKLNKLPKTPTPPDNHCLRKSINCCRDGLPNSLRTLSKAIMISVTAMTITSMH